MLVQGRALPDNRAYLDGCSTVMAFKTNKHLQKIKTMPGGIKINCNAGAVSTNRMGTYGNLKVWYILDGIAKIFSMHELKKQYHITYDSWEGHYIVHTPKGEVKSYKDKQGLLTSSSTSRRDARQLSCCYRVCSKSMWPRQAWKYYTCKRCAATMKVTPRKTCCKSRKRGMHRR
jgi:hypothetical protein